MSANPSLKVMRPDLKARVFTLAMLLPIMSIMDWWFFSPASPVLSEFSMEILGAD
mgnify:CR=1 FL=1